ADGRGPDRLVPAALYADPEWPENHDQRCAPGTAAIHRHLSDPAAGILWRFQRQFRGRNHRRYAPYPGAGGMPGPGPGLVVLSAAGLLAENTGYVAAVVGAARQPGPVPAGHVDVHHILPVGLACQQTAAKNR